MGTSHKEFDLAYTSYFQAADFEGTGNRQLVFGQGWSHPEGIGEGEGLHLLDDDGSDTVPFAVDARLDDVDRDGHDDILLTFETTTNLGPCPEDEPNNVWNPATLTAIKLLIHAQPNGRFTFDDAAATAYREAQCSGAGHPLVRGHAALIDEGATAKNLLCSRANGQDAYALHEAITNACSVAYDYERDCRKRRPHVCLFTQELHAWLDALDAAMLWARGEEIVGQCAQCCPRVEHRAMGRRRAQNAGAYLANFE